MLPVRYEWEQRANVLVSAHITICHLCPLEFFLLKNLRSKLVILKWYNEQMYCYFLQQCMIWVAFWTYAWHTISVPILKVWDYTFNAWTMKASAENKIIAVRKHQTCFQTSRMLLDMSFRPMTCESNPDCSMTQNNENWTLYRLNSSISQQVALSISSLTMFSASLFLFRNWRVFRHDRMSHSAWRLCSLSTVYEANQSSHV